MQWRSTSFYLIDGAAADQARAQVLREFSGYLGAYAEFGLNSVALTWFNPVNVATGRLATEFASDLPEWRHSLPTNDLLIAMTRAAHAQDFKVMWKPHFVTNDAKAGNINPYFTGPGFDTDTFLAEVNGFWRRLAPAAERAHADLLILGTEHEAYAGPARDANWRSIIQTARSHFSGEITYDALSYMGRGGVAADDITFWDALDYIGVSMYLPLNVGGLPLFAEAVRLLRAHPIFPGDTGPLVDVPAMLKSLSDATGKPVLFTEAGSQSRAGALGSGPIDRLEAGLVA